MWSPLSPIPIDADNGVGDLILGEITIAYVRRIPRAPPRRAAGVGVSGVVGCVRYCRLGVTIDNGEDDASKRTSGDVGGRGAGDDPNKDSKSFVPE